MRNISMLGRTGFARRIACLRHNRYIIRSRVGSYGIIITSTTTGCRHCGILCGLPSFDDFFPSWGHDLQLGGHSVWGESRTPDPHPSKFYVAEVAIRNPPWVMFILFWYYSQVPTFFMNQPIL